MNRSFQPPDRAEPKMEQISTPLHSVDICSISESCFLTCFEFWVENVSRDIDNINFYFSKNYPKETLINTFLPFFKMFMSN